MMKKKMRCKEYKRCTDKICAHREPHIDTGWCGGTSECKMSPNKAVHWCRPIKEKMVRITISLPIALVLKIDRTRAKLGMSRSAFIRMCIEKELLKKGA